MGGLLFGFDQGILSVVYTMTQFLGDFPEIDPAQSSSAGLNKGWACTTTDLPTNANIQYHDGPA
jgi:hypothetical protein